MIDGENITEEKLEKIEKRDPDFFAALARARYIGIACAVGLAIVLVLLVWGTIANWQQGEDIQRIKPNIEGGQATCSGGNASACDRVCVATRARLRVLDEHGRTLESFCVPSRITAAVQEPQGGTTQGGSQQRSVPVTTLPGSTGGSTPKTPTSRQPSATPKQPAVRPPGNPGGGSENGGGGQTPNPTPTPTPAPSIPLPSVCVNNPLLPICLNIK